MKITLSAMKMLIEYGQLHGFSEYEITGLNDPFLHLKTATPIPQIIKVNGRKVVRVIPQPALEEEL